VHAAAQAFLFLPKGAGDSMSQQLNTLYKLMTMYTLSRVDFALTNSQITNVFLDLGYTNYFNVQYALGELVDSGLVHEEAYPDYRYYALTDSGKTSMDALRSSLSSSIRSDIDDYLKKRRLEFREALSSRAEYYRTTDGDWAVRCRVMDHTTALIDMTLTVPNETQAKAVSQEWKEKSQEIYAMVIRKLTQPDHIDRIVEQSDQEERSAQDTAIHE
jgi:DNA-binding PadR family transcriptional regulator